MHNKDKINVFQCKNNFTKKCQYHNEKWKIYPSLMDIFHFSLWYHHIAIDASKWLRTRIWNWHKNLSILVQCFDEDAIYYNQSIITSSGFSPQGTQNTLLCYIITSSRLSPQGTDTEHFAMLYNYLIRVFTTRNTEHFPLFSLESFSKS